jgi:hypothetical protein
MTMGIVTRMNTLTSTSTATVTKVKSQKTMDIHMRNLLLIMGTHMEMRIYTGYSSTFWPMLLVQWR